ncbi:hypothetical protein GGI21_004991 [Coemansia aciculifera]|nr:hypothetical protein GGI21_004991 [Coemansia aciculifera]
MYEMLEDRGVALNAASGEPANANFRAGAQSVPPALQQQQQQQQYQAGMDQDGSGSAAAAAAQAQLQNMLRLSGATGAKQQQNQQFYLRLRQQLDKEHAARRGMAYANAQMGDMYNNTNNAAGGRGMPLSLADVQTSSSSVAGQPSASSSNLAEDVATASMV